MLENQLIVSFSMNRWYGKWSEKQSILSEFARQGNQAVQIEHPFHAREVLWGRTGGSRAGLQRVDERLYHYVPPRLLPRFYGNHLLSRSIERLRIRRIRSALRQVVSDPRPILYIWHPDYVHMVGEFNERCVVYHKFDRYPIVGDPSPDLIRRERELIERADVCLTVSQEIVAMDPMFSEFRWMPNGAEFERFQAALADDEPEPADLAAIPHPRVGYVGAINRKLNFAVLEALAGSLPRHSFVLVGPEQIERDGDRAAMARLRARDNVHFLGLKGFDVYPRYVAGLDAGLILNTADNAEWVRYCYPLKLHEYLACGLPVISTDIPAVREFSDVVHIAGTEAEWVEAVREGIASGDQAARQRRIEVARVNSWSHRVASISSLIEAALS